VIDYAREHGKSLFTQGLHELSEAKVLSNTHGPTVEAEGKARAALATLRSAMNWLEDTDAFEEAHRALDEAGSFTRHTFGCSLHQDRERYEQRCPVALGHTRIGLSIGFIVRRVECSICSQDPVSCEHVTGRTYDGQLCQRILTEVEPFEISLVDRPAQPDARILAVSVPVAELREALGPQFQPGMAVSCDRCLGPCSGLSRPFHDS
jgi:hypothetical protein